jgi:hypothetical protein
MKRPRNEVPTEWIKTTEIAVLDDKPRGGSKEIDALAREIERQKGIHFPIIVMSVEDGLCPYAIKNGWGRKRLDAICQLKWKEVMVVIMPSFSKKENPIKVASAFASVIEACLHGNLSDYDLARAACEMEDRHKVKGAEFARVLGISQGYTYNLMRWLRHLPKEVLDSWKDGSRLINQTALEHMSHLEKPEALAYFRKLTAMRTIPEPTSPERKEGRRQRLTDRRKRPSETKLIKLGEAVEESVLKQPVKDLCLHFVRYSMGVVKQIPGITDYKKLDPSLVRPIEAA